MTLKLYFDFLSQPSRALFIFLKLNKIPFEACSVALRNGVHLTDEFKTKFNRFQKVPFIHDREFKLSESVAIIRYLAREYNLDNKWYPKDSKKQAQVDEYLEWQHNNTRAFCALYFQKKWLFPLLTGESPVPEQLQKFEDNMISTFNNIENIWLADTPFLSGSEVSVADIFAACEIEQPRIAGFEPRQGRPKLAAWLDRVRNEANPYYDEAHTILNKMAKKGGQAKL
jgi:glutathione S-transferase